MPQVDLKDNIEAMLDLIQTPNSPQSSEAFAEEWVKMFIGEGTYSPYAINAKATSKALLGDYADAKDSLYAAFVELCSLGQSGIGSPAIASQKLGDTLSAYFTAVLWIPIPPYFLAIINPASIETAKISLMTDLQTMFANSPQTANLAADQTSSIFHTFCTNLELFCTRPDASPPYIVVETANLEL